MPGLPVASQLTTATKVLNAPIIPDGNAANVRGGPHGEPYVISPYNGNQAAAVERSYYTFAQEGTRNTGVNLTNATGTSYSAAQALLVVYNSNPPGGPDIIMDYLALKIDAAITGGTFWHIYHAMDQVNRYSSGGAAMNGYNVDGAQPPGVLAYSGVVVSTSAGPSVRDVGWNIIANGLSAIGAMHVIHFGRLEQPQSGAFTIPTTGVAVSVFDAPPVVIPPGSCYVMNEFQTARSATAVGEVFMGAFVR